MTNDVKDEPCAFCGGLTDRYAGNPSLWPVWFCHPDGSGVSRAHHEGCVSKRCFPAAQQDVRETAASNVTQMGRRYGGTCGHGVSLAEHCASCADLQAHDRS